MEQRYKRWVIILGVAILCAIVLVRGGLRAGEWITATLSPSTTDRPVVTLSLNDVALDAIVVHLDTRQASTSGMLVKQGEALFIILDEGASVPAVTFTNRSVDVLWLDGSLAVIDWEQQRASQTQKPLNRPETARYALLAQSSTIPAEAFATGFQILVSDQSLLTSNSGQME